MVYNLETTLTIWFIAVIFLRKNMLVKIHVLHTLVKLIWGDLNAYFYPPPGFQVSKFTFFKLCYMSQHPKVEASPRLKKKKKKSNNAFVQVSRDCHGVISADSLVQISHHPVTIPNLLQLCISESDPCLYNLTNSSKTRGVPYSWQLMSYLKILVQTLLSIFPQAEISPQENHGHDLALNSWSLLQSTTYSTSIL